MTESEGHLVLPVRIHKLLFDLHLGTMTQHAFDHRRHLGRRTGFELGVDTGGMPFDTG